MLACREGCLCCNCDQSEGSLVRPERKLRHHGKPRFHRRNRSVTPPHSEQLPPQGGQVDLSAVVAQILLDEHRSKGGQQLGNNPPRKGTGAREDEDASIATLAAQALHRDLVFTVQRSATPPVQQLARGIDHRQLINPLGPPAQGTPSQGAARWTGQPSCFTHPQPGGMPLGAAPVDPPRPAGGPQLMSANPFAVGPGPLAAGGMVAGVPAEGVPPHGAAVRSTSAGPVTADQTRGVSFATGPPGLFSSRPTAMHAMMAASPGGAPAQMSAARGVGGPGPLQPGNLLAGAGPFMPGLAQQPQGGSTVVHSPHSLRGAAPAGTTALPGGQRNPLTAGNHVSPITTPSASSRHGTPNGARPTTTVQRPFSAGPCGMQSSVTAGTTLAASAARGPVPSGTATAAAGATPGGPLRSTTPPPAGFLSGKVAGGAVGATTGAPGWAAASAMARQSVPPLMAHPQRVLTDDHRRAVTPVGRLPTGPSRSGVSSPSAKRGGAAATTTKSSPGSVATGTQQHFAWGARREISASELTPQHRELSRRTVETQVTAPRRVQSQVVEHRRQIIPEKRLVEEIVEETQTVTERIVEVAKPVIKETLVASVNSVDVQQQQQEVHECVRHNIQESTKETVIEIPEIEVKEVDVVKQVPVQAYREEIRVIEKAVPQYIDTYVPDVRNTRRSVPVPRLLPIPLEKRVETTIYLPSIVTAYEKVPLPVYVPHFIEAPVAADVLDAEFRESCERACAEIAELATAAQKSSVSLCKLETIGVQMKEFEQKAKLAVTERNPDTQQTNLLTAWEKGKLNIDQDENSVADATTEAGSTEPSTTISRNSRQVSWTLPSPPKV